MAFLLCVCVWEFWMQIAQPELCKGIFFWGFAGWGFVKFVQILQRKCRKGHFGDDAPVSKKPRRSNRRSLKRGDEPNSNVMNKLTKKRSSLSLRYLYLAWDPMMALGNPAQKGNSSFNHLKTLTFHDRSCRTSPWSFCLHSLKVTISHRPTLKTGLLTQGRPLLFPASNPWFSERNSSHVIWPKPTCQVQVTRVHTLPLRDAFLLPHARRV